MKELCNTLGIEQNLSTAYHPQTDGQTERINQEVEAYLRAFINYRQNDWSKWLPTAEFQYNNKVHSGTKHSPFFLNYGLHPWKGTLSTTTSNPSANDFTSELIKVCNEAKTALQSYNGNVKYQTRTRVITQELVEAGQGKPRWKGLASTCVLRPSQYHSAQISGW
jgi:hypothetical protein